MDKYDVEHMQDALNFKIPLKLDKVLTGHIDIIQLRNGAVHIMDYKPRASAGKQSGVVSQLTLYALMLSRLTGFRVYDFKCGWFDNEVYYEFFPLHVVYLEQIRDIYAGDTDSVVFNDIVKEYFFSRRKIFNLYKAWRRIDEQYRKGK